MNSAQSNFMESDFIESLPKPSDKPIFRKPGTSKYFKAQGMSDEQIAYNLRVGIKPPKTPQRREEDEIEKEVAEWLNIHNIKSVHFPNELFRAGMWRAWHNGVKDSRGFPDRIVLLPLPLFIEFKKPGEKPKPEQIEWMQKLELLYPGRVLWTDNAQEAIEFVKKHLKLNQTQSCQKNT